MGSEYLSSYIANSAERADFDAEELAKHPGHELGVELCFHYRQHAGSTFLHTGNTIKFFECMQRSAGSFIFALQNEKESEKRSSENEAFFDAVCAGLADAATAIAKYSRSTWNRDYEYEDDFLYMHFLMSFFYRRDSMTNADFKGILEQYALVLNGDLSTRFDLCQSFFDQDPEKFASVFERFLLEREEHINVQIERDVIGEEEWAWSKYISVEALSLLQFATKLNFKTETNYRQAPEQLRRSPATRFDADLWRSPMGV